MKKFFNLMLMAVAVLSFNACSDVPAPYDLNSKGGSAGSAEGVYVNESFSSSFGSFKLHTVKGVDWVIDYSTAKATGYNTTDKTNSDSESYLVSKEIDLTSSSGAYIMFDYILRYKTKDATKYTDEVRITDNYTGDPTTTTWENISGDLVEGSDWSTFYEYKQDIPSKYLGKKVRVALYYTSANMTSGSSTWEVKNFKVREGKAGGSVDPDPTPSGDDYLNETFASSLGVFTAKTIKGTAWVNDYSTAKATGYNSTDKTYTESEAYLVSKAVDLSAAKSPILSFEYILRYKASDINNKVLVSSNYNDDPTTATWTDITGELVEGSDWKTFSNYSVALPAEFVGKSNVVVALYYDATNSKSATWEVKNLKLAEGSVEPEPEPTPSADYLNETFATKFGDFTLNAVSGTPWVIDYSTAKASGYDNSSKTYTASKSYLVSKVVDLSAAKSPVLSFEYILRYKANGTNKVYVTDNYTGSPVSTTWTDITGDLTEGSDWKTFSNYSVALPAEFVGKSSVVIAFYYECSETQSGTWEVKNLKLAEGSVEPEPEPEPEPTPTPTPSGDELLSNNSFETWTSDSEPTGWKSAGKASNATLSKSTDAHSGSYSVQAEGYASANKRLAAAEITLPAGDYVMTFYVKAATAEGGSVRPGYAKDGSSDSMTYGDYVNNLTNTEWTQVTYNFTLAAETTLSPVVMVAKSPGKAVLVDDISLKKATASTSKYIRRK